MRCVKTSNKEIEKNINLKMKKNQRKNCYQIQPSKFYLYLYD